MTVDIGRYEALLRDPGKTSQDLQNMRRNALAKEAFDHANLAEQVLQQRFPRWQTPSGRGGSKPTVAMFEGHSIEFPSQKEAYIWLINQFVACCPEPFETIDWQTRFIAKGPRTLYFSRSLSKLFATSPEHAANPAKYHRMSHGWFAKLILSEPQKLDILFKFSAVAKLHMGRNWDWIRRGEDATSVDELLAELARSRAREPWPPSPISL